MVEGGRDQLKPLKYGNMVAPRPEAPRVPVALRLPGPPDSGGLQGSSWGLPVGDVSACPRPLAKLTLLKPSEAWFFNENLENVDLFFLGGG